MKERIVGVDVARALAVIGMIIVNFKMVLGQGGETWLSAYANLFDGKAAASFVVLAGVGIAFISNKAIQKQDSLLIKKLRVSLLKRAFLLFVLGLSYWFIWPADILHFYGVYMLVCILLLKFNTSRLLYSALGLIFIYPLLMLCFDYEAGWNFVNFNYIDFWSPTGFIRNLFYNGFHPVAPWAAFMLIGLWFGRHDLSNKVFVKKAMWFSLSIFIFIQLLSFVSIQLLSSTDETAIQELQQILGTSPMPPLPIYMLSGSSIAIFIISFCILISEYFNNTLLVIVLARTGKLALSFYIAHVVFGMGLVELLFQQELGSYSLSFSFLYALVFSALCVLFATLWLKYKKQGPVEWVFRKLSH